MDNVWVLSIDNDWEPVFEIAGAYQSLEGAKAKADTLAGVGLDWAGADASFEGVFNDARGYVTYGITRVPVN